MKNIDFTKGNGLVPAIVQDADTRVVLMLGYMNQEALTMTETSGMVTFYSRSKDRIWTKGEESGNYLRLVEVRADCDRDALLIKAKPSGPVCHRGTDTCWEETNENRLGFLEQLEEVISNRQQEAGSEDRKGSYVVSLFQEGINKIAQKVGEEAVETIIEAKDADKTRFLNESADLLFHFMVLLRAKGHGLSDVVSVLEGRHQKAR